MRTNLVELMGRKQAATGEKVNQKVVSDATGLSLQTVNAWYHGKVDSYKKETIKRLCEYFNCDINELLIVFDVPESEAQ